MAIEIKGYEGAGMTGGELDNKVKSFQQTIIDSQVRDIQKITWDYTKLQAKYTKLKETIWKIKADISDSRIGKYGIPQETIKIDDCLKIIDKHLKEVENDN